jgi:eukaryotic-like serine/threonine-protein kinase
MQIAAGTRLGPYEVVAPIGAGGMGEVYEALDPRLDRRVAIKVLAPHLLSRPDALARFEREARLVASLSHPNVVAIFDIGVDDEARRFVVTELLEGDTLRGRLGEGPIPWRNALEMIIAVCNGLEAAHSRGIVHRDVKPENVFLTLDGQIKVLDFGLARLDELRSGALSETEKTIARTPAGLVLGTVGYMSPEQVRGDAAEIRSDLFSVGCILYELLTGERPFNRPTQAETMHAILKEQPAPMASLRSGIPLELESIVFRCLEKEPAKRFFAAHDLSVALRALLTGSQPTVALPGRRDRKSHSVAVLPFTSSGGGSEGEQLGSLVAEHLISHLSAGTRLRVVARGASFRFRGEHDAQEIGRQLRASVLLTGNLSRLGQAWSVYAELIDTSDGTQLWGEQLTLTESDSLALVEAVARQIATKVQQRLGGAAPRKKSRKPKAISSESQQALTDARGQASLGTESSIRKAIEILEESLQRTPDNAAALAALADACLRQAMESLASPAEVREKAVTSAAHAVEVAEDSAEAHVALGACRGFLEWNWTAAKQEIETGLELNAADPAAHIRIGELLAMMGSAAEAIRHTEEALRLDSTSAVTNAAAGRTFFLLRRYDEAIGCCHKAIIAVPDAASPRATLALALAHRTLFKAAADELQKAAGDDREMSAALGYVYAMWDKKAGARKIADKLAAPARKRAAVSYLVSRIYAALGAVDDAFQQLEAAFAERAPHLSWLLIDPCLDPLRSDRRFEDLLRRMAL